MFKNSNKSSLNNTKTTKYLQQMHINPSNTKPAAKKNPNILGGSKNNYNTKHCRSLVDLNPSEISEIPMRDNHSRNDKENINHFCSVSSHREEDDCKKANVVSNSSNIRKILMGAQPQSRNNQKKIVQNIKNNSNKNNSTQATMFGNNKKPIFAYNMSNNQVQYKNMRTSSQTSIHSEKQQPQRNMTKFVQHQKNEEISTDYNLLIKLKQYIEQLKSNEQKLKSNEQQLKKREKQYVKQIEELERQNTLLQDKIEVLVIRQQQMVRKIKDLNKAALAHQNNKNSMSNNSKMQECKNCQQNELIIQSLKNVINEQLGKIIQLQRNRLQSIIHTNNQKQEQKNNYSNNKTIEEEQSFVSAAESEGQEIRNRDQKKREPEVYSFKKEYQQKYVQQENESQQADECGRDQEQNQILMRDLEAFKNYPQVYTKNGKKNMEKMDRNQRNLANKYEIVKQGNFFFQKNSVLKNKNSLEGVPQPYHQILKGLKSDTSRRESHQQIQQSGKKSNQQQNSHNLEQYDGKKQDNQDEYSYAENPLGQGGQGYQEEYSEDGILQQVGNYLSNIRNNVKNHRY